MNHWEVGQAMDGITTDSDDNPPTFTQPVDNPNGPVYVNPSIYNFVGWISDVRIYSSALTASEISNIYYFGSPLGEILPSVFPAESCDNSVLAISNWFKYFPLPAGTNVPPLPGVWLSNTSNDMAITYSDYWSDVVNDADFSLALVPNCFSYPVLPDASAVAWFESFSAGLDNFNWYDEGNLQLRVPPAGSSAEIVSLWQQLNSLKLQRITVEAALNVELTRFFSYQAQDRALTLNAVTYLFLANTIDQIQSEIRALAQAMEEQSIIDLVFGVLNVVTIGVGAFVGLSSTQRWTSHLSSWILPRQPSILVLARKILPTAIRHQMWRSMRAETLAEVRCRMRRRTRFYSLISILPVILFFMPRI